ncbi:hypothetical protein AX17_003626 [Amanita inopinata Kibby_2008]|nr:hypothetical protein AX17_003626 [Amanita inopinata Kibby_2008]
MVTITSEDELQQFYKHHYQPSKEIKFVVQDLQLPDSTLASTWSADSNLYGSSGDDDWFTLFCWVLTESSNPFSVNVRKSIMVDELKQAIKKEKECMFAGVERDTLKLWKLSPPIPSAEIATKLNVTRAASIYLSAPRSV